MKKSIIMLALLITAVACTAQKSPIPDTIKMSVTEGGVTYSKFTFTPTDLFVTLPGEINPINLGEIGNKFYYELGVIPGYQVWGFSKDTAEYRYAFRLVMTEVAIGVEIVVPKWEMTLKYGRTECLYLTDAPDVYLDFKDNEHLRKIGQARILLEQLFMRKFRNFAPLDCPVQPVPMPNRK